MKAADLKYRNDNKRRKAGLVSSGFIAAAVILFFVNPAENFIYPPCWFKEVTGLYCPGCGGLRSAHQLLQGNFLNALDYNLLIIFVFPLSVYLFLSQLRLFIFGKQLRELPSGKALISAAVVIMLTFWILRNISGSLFGWLAP